MFGTPSGVARHPTPLPVRGAASAGAHQAIITLPGGQRLGPVVCEAITRAGFFAVTDTPPPPLLARVRVDAVGLGGLSCEGEVVQHLSAQQAREWQRAPGFAVQFIDLTLAQRTGVEHALGLTTPSSTPSRGLPHTQKDDPLVSAVLARFGPRFENNPYALLGLSPETGFPELRARWRDATRDLEHLEQRRLSEAQRDALAQARRRVQGAFEAVGTPAHRLRFDAGIGNYVGVARCLMAGIPVAELEKARARYLAEHPGAESHGQVERMRAHAFEQAHATAEALAAWEASLRHDPLHLDALKRFATLRSLR